jgi:hypothetical protein
MQLKIGILVVGSLDWESKEYPGCQNRLNPERSTWRKRWLKKDAGSELRVNVPIRYGRLSSTRGDTYTMVFSPEYKSRPGGQAKIIESKSVVTDCKDLQLHAQALWQAESGYANEVSRSWGCVVLLTPDNFLQSDEINRRQLLKEWADYTSGRPGYANIRFSTQDVAEAKKLAETKKLNVTQVIDNGLLQIPWPTLTTGEPVELDLILATATQAEIPPGYPDNEKIVAAWDRSRNYAHYFWCNRVTGIQTADDADLEQRLLALGITP